MGVPSYTVLDVALHYERNGWEAALNVSNLFDKSYFSASYPEAAYDPLRSRLASSHAARR